MSFFSTDFAIAQSKIDDAASGILDIFDLTLIVICESAYSNLESNQIDSNCENFLRIEYLPFRIRIQSNQNKISLAKICVKTYTLR